MVYPLFPLFPIHDHHSTIQAFFLVVFGGFFLGISLPEVETFITALGSATTIWKIIDRVRRASQFLKLETELYNSLVHMYCILPLK